MHTYCMHAQSSIYTDLFLHTLYSFAHSFTHLIYLHTSICTRIDTCMYGCTACSVCRFYFALTFSRRSVVFIAATATAVVIFVVN